MFRFCYIFLRKKRINFQNLYDFDLCLPKYLDISYSKIWNLIQFQDFFYQKLHFFKKNSMSSQRIQNRNKNIRQCHNTLLQGIFRCLSPQQQCCRGLILPLLTWAKSFSMQNLFKTYLPDDLYHLNDHIVELYLKLTLCLFDQFYC